MDGVELEAFAVTKTYGTRSVVRDVSARFAPGRLYAVVGENGAGKSTLLKMLAGVVAPSAGEVRIDGNRLHPATPATAMAFGVGMVHQHFSLVETLTGLENLMLGAEPTTHFGVLRPQAFRRRIEALVRETGLAAELDDSVRNLSVAARQRLEILRVLSRGARALLLDEPTAILPSEAANALYDWLRERVRTGATVIVVTHHLDEVIRYADHVTVMRAGDVRWAGDVAEQTLDGLASLALGEKTAVPPPAPPALNAAVRLALRALTTDANELAPAPLNGLSLAVRAGEVVGIAGIDGNGQEAFSLGLAGLVPVRAGTIVVDGTDLTHASPRERRRAGMELIYADRHAFGLIVGATVHDNAVLGDLVANDEATRVDRRLRDGAVAPADPTLDAGALSGGNQQKLVVARALDRNPRVLIAAYPTRGVDAAAAGMLRAQIAAAARAGAAVVLLSEEIAELRALSHRIVVIARGRIAAELDVNVGETELGRAMMSAGNE